jgi:uncharacterized protein (UPF0332 family)
MFHAARALVYSRGYGEKSHYCLSVALRALVIEEGRLDAQSGRDFLNACQLPPSMTHPSLRIKVKTIEPDAEGYRQPLSH